MAQSLRLASGAPATYARAVERYLGAAGIAPSSQRISRIALTTWRWLLVGAQPPTARRGARAPQRTGFAGDPASPPDVPFATLDDPELPARLATSFATRATATDPATVNRERSILRAALTWWRAQGWLRDEPPRGLRRLPAPPDRTRALTRAQIAALFRLDVALREKAYWRLLYETAARAQKILTLDIGDLHLANKRARSTAKGGAVEWVHWQSASAQLLPRLLRGRAAGPVFLTERAAPARTPTLDRCPLTGRARLSYRRATERLTAATRALDDAGVGWTLHQLRHAALTHEAEDGTNTPLLLARSRHASVRSLERYARPSVDAVAAHVAARDPAARRRR